MSLSKSRNTREISDILHFAAIHFLPERHSAMVLIYIYRNGHQPRSHNSCSRIRVQVILRLLLLAGSNFSILVGFVVFGRY